MVGQRCRKSVALEALGTERVHEAAQLLERRRRPQLEVPQRRLRRGIVRCQRCRACREHEAEERLRRRIVQLASDPVALLDDGKLLRARVEVGVRDRDARIRRERFQAPRVSPRERADAVAADEQVADHDAAMRDRHAEEVGEGRVMRGVVGETRVLADVVEADRSFLEQRAKHAVRPRQLADRRGTLVADARRDEAREPAATVWDSDRRVARIRLPARCAHDAIEDGIEVRRVAECQQLEHLGGDGIRVDACGHRSGC